MSGSVPTPPTDPSVPPDLLHDPAHPVMEHDWHPGHGEPTVDPTPPPDPFDPQPPAPRKPPTP